MIPVGSPGRTGDGIKMAFSVGAVGDNMGPMMVNGAFMPAEGEAICNGPNKDLNFPPIFTLTSAAAFSGAKM